MHSLVLGTFEQQPMLYAIGLGIVVVIVGIVILANHLESKYATKKHDRDFKKAYENDQKTSRRSSLKREEKVPEYTRVEAF